MPDQVTTASRSRHRRQGSWVFGAVALAVISLAFGTALLPAQAQELKPDIVKSVFHLTTKVPSDARTAATLGTEREGSAILIDDHGLLLTISYLLTEAISAEVRGIDGQVQPAVVLGIDQDTGLGVLRAEGLNQSLVAKSVAPIALGSAIGFGSGRTLLALSFGGMSAARPVKIVSRRDFAGGWEYLLSGAIFTAPPQPAWSGSALVDEHGRLVGIGSLLLADVAGEDSRAASTPGNMFVPIDSLAAELDDLQQKGRPALPHHPWLGISLRERSNRVTITQISAGGPAEKAGLTSGAEIVGVGDAPIDSLADLYRRIWAAGPAGVEVPLTIMDHGSRRTVGIRSISRYEYLKSDSTY